jgi:Flp pilus assembly protein TadG
MRAYRRSRTGPGFLRDERGATAVEFILILAPLIALTLGAINAGLAVYTTATLLYAADDAARCATVRTTVCDTAVHLQAYAAARYGGLTAAPTFTLTKPADGQPCEKGNLVTATANYHFETGLTSTVIPLTAKGCYPLS